MTMAPDDDRIDDCIADDGKAWTFEVSAAPIWTATIPAWRAVLARVGQTIAPVLVARLSEAGTLAPVEIAVLLADDDAVRDLNRDWRGKDTPTNVLSFASWWDDDCPPPPAPGVPLMLGDLALALQTLTAEAAREGKSPDDHFAHLALHGVLHLLGYDHIDADDAREMETLEIRLLAAIGVADPYGEAGLRGDSDHD
jgi:probable rRNA maturation factor